MNPLSPANTPLPDELPPGRRASDYEVVQSVIGGNQAAYEKIMRRYNRRLFRLARGILNDDDEARDAVQESYVRAYFRLSQFRGPHGFASWLCRITINEAMNRARRRTRLERAEVGDLRAATASQPENQAHSAELLRRIEVAIAELPVEFRTVFMLRGVEQLSVAETAEFLDLNPATVKTRFHRARKRLRARLCQEIDGAISQAFGFDGPRCDAIVAHVFTRLAGAGLPDPVDDGENP